MRSGTPVTPTPQRITGPLAAALLLTVGLLCSGCQTTAAVAPAIVVVDSNDVVGVANMPGDRMSAV